MLDEDIRYWVWYNCALHGRPKLSYEIYKIVGDIKKIYEFEEADFRDVGISSESALKALCNKDLSSAEKQIWYANNYNVDVIPITSDSYPKDLKFIEDPPVMLYMRGTHFDPNNELYVTIVGTRRCTEYAKDMAYDIAGELAEKGITVVSAMSSPIDVAAHQGCLNRGGKTVAVLGTGVNKAYPKDNKELMLNIMNNGCVLSEYNFDGRVFATFFRDRNRILTGLSKGTLIVEAGEKSGAMLVASCAFDQNRDLFAVPGNSDAPASIGTNRLLKSCAKPVTCADDIIAEYETVYRDLFRQSQYTAKTVEFDIPDDSGKLEQKILELIDEFPRSNDELARELDVPVSEINGSITMLEMLGSIKEDVDGKYRKKA